MIARLWYAGLLALSAFAVLLGLGWPSLLTLLALVATVIAALAVVGLVSPDALRRRPRLLRAVRWGAYLLCAEVVLVTALSVWNQQRSVTLVLNEPAPALVRVVYDVRDGSPIRRLSWNRTFEVPASGIVHTRHRRDFGGYDPHNAHSLIVRLARVSGDTVPLTGTWFRGGFVRDLDCQYMLDDYIIGREFTDADTAPDTRPSSWLDSTHTWGVACRNGRLEVAAEPGAIPSPRPRWICHWVKDGSMSCGNSPQAP